MKILLQLLLNLLLCSMVLAGPLWEEPPPTQSPADSLLGPAPRLFGGQWQDQDPALSADGRWLAWSRLEEGNHDLWLQDLQETGDPPLRLTRHVAADHSPRFRPDGKALLFVSHREDAAGDLWELPLKKRFGRLKPGKARRLLSRKGEQARPAVDGLGGLVWEEESRQGRCVMRLSPDNELRVLARPAAMPVPGHGGLYLLAVPDGEALRLEWIADSLLDKARLRDPRRLIRSFSLGLTDLAVGPGPWLTWIRLRDTADGHPGELPSATGVLERYLPGSQLPYPLLEKTRQPRQLSLGEGQMILSEGRKDVRLWLEDPEGRIPVDLDNRTRWELLEAHQGGALQRPLLEQVLAHANEAGEPAPALLALIDLELEDGYPGRAGAWLAYGLQRGTDNALGRQLQIRALLLADSLHGKQADQLRDSWNVFPGAQASLLMAQTRSLTKNLAGDTLQLSPDEAGLAGSPDMLAALERLSALQELDASLPEQAEGLAMRAGLLGRIGSERSSRGALAQLATGYPDEPQLLADWLSAELKVLPKAPAPRRLALLALLDDLREIRPLKLALILELARLELQNPAAGAELVREDLRAVLLLDPLELSLFEQRVWCEAAWMDAELAGPEQGFEVVVQSLERAEGELEGEGDLQDWLRARRVDRLLDEARTQFRAADPVLAAVLCKRALELDDSDTRLWRLRLQALSLADSLEAEELRLRARLANSVRTHERALSHYSLGLLLSWQAEHDPGRIPESQIHLDLALALQPTLAAACLAQSWNLSRELELAAGKRGGVAGLLRELGRGSEALGRLKHRGLGGLEDPDEESLRDKAILLLDQGLNHVDAELDPELAAALEQNLGNLFFSMGEFGAGRAREAWLRRLEHSPDFLDKQAELMFRAKLGIASHWAQDRATARGQLENAEELAAALGQDELRRALLGRLALLDMEDGRRQEAISRFRACLALESHPGQRALLLRDMAFLELDGGSDEQARQWLEAGARELRDGQWPLQPEQNWLRLQLLGISIPLWNFPDLYTGEGRLDWSEREEELLRLTLEEELLSRSGQVDKIETWQRRRIALVAKQPDPQARFQLELELVKLLAVQGEELAALELCAEAESRARKDLQSPGLRLRALESMLGLTELLREDSLESSAAGPWRRNVLDLLQDVRSEGLEQPGLHFTQELLFVRALENAALEAPPLEAFMLRARALLLLEDLEGWRREQGIRWTVDQDVALAAATARMLLATGSAREALQGLQVTRPAYLLPTQALALDAAQLECCLALEDREAGRKSLCQLLESLEQIPEFAGRALAQRQENALLQLVEAALARGWGLADCGPESSEAFADWKAWRAGLQSWAIVQPEFGSEQLQLLWNRHREDLAERERLLTRLQKAESERDLAALHKQDSLLQENETAWKELELREQVWFAWQREVTGVTEEGSCAFRSELLRAFVPLARRQVAWITDNGPAPKGTFPISPLELLAEEPSGLDRTILVMDGVLHLQPELPATSWIQFAGTRVELRDLLKLDLGAEALFFRQVEWSGQDPNAWDAGRSCLESMLLQVGCRSAWLALPETSPAPGELLAAMSSHWNTAGIQLSGTWWRVGPEQMPQDSLDVARASSFEELVRRGNALMKASEWSLAWRSYRRALGIALDDNRGQDAARLLELSARAVARGGLSASASREIRAIVDELPQAEVNWNRLSPGLGLLFDLAGERAYADSLFERMVRAPDAKEPRTLLLGRVSDLVKHQALERAVELALAASLRPKGADPRPALFLAKLYLDTEWSGHARLCLLADEVQWAQLPAQTMLDYHELKALVSLRLDELGLAKSSMHEAAQLVARHPFKPERVMLHALRQAELAWRLGSWLEADRYLDRGDSLKQLLEKPQLELQLANLRGLLMMKTGRLRESGVHLEQARQLAMSLDDPLEWSAVCNNLALLALKRGEAHRALEWVERAEEQDSRSGSRRRKLSSLRNRAKVLVQLEGPRLTLGGSWSDLPMELLAKREAGKALQLLATEIEQSLDSAGPSDPPRDLLRLELALAEVRLLQEQPAGVAAQMREKAADARRLLALDEELHAGLLEARALAFEDVSPAERIELLEKLRSRNLAEQDRWLNLRFDPARGHLMSELAEMLVALYLEQGQVASALAASESARSLGMREMLARNPKRHVPAVPSAEEIQELLAAMPADMEFLAWHTGPQQSWWMWYQDSRWTHGKLPLSQDELELLAQRHLERLLAFQSTKQTGRELAQALLPDSLYHDLPKRLLLMPQGTLHRLPFSTLHVEEDEPLGVVSALQQVGSFSMLRRCMDDAVPTESASCWLADDQGRDPDLAYASLEAAELEWIYPQLRLYEGGAATRSAFLDQGPCSVLHLACHARASRLGPAGSVLQLEGEDGESRDLGAAEIARADLNCGIAVLSACDTALEGSALEAAADLPRAFVAAGASSVVASLWKVEDFSTALFMKHLHRALAAGEPADLALLHARRSLYSTETMTPALWAAFNLYGAGWSTPVIP